MRVVGFQLREETVEAVDEAAERLGMSRSEFFRTATLAFLQANHENTRGRDHSEEEA